MGGTHYYIESLLWRVLLDDDPSMEDDDLICGRKRPTMDDLSSTEDDDQLLTCLTFDQDALPEHFTGPRLHQLLRKVDPAMADAIHPNNRRKIIR